MYEFIKDAVLRSPGIPWDRDGMTIRWEDGKGGGDGSDDATDDTDKSKDKDTTDAADKKPDKKKKTPEAVPYDRFKEVNDDLRDAQVKIKANDDAEEERKTAAAKESGKYEALYEEEKGKREQGELDLMKRDVAIAKGLPKDFIDRLQGKNEGELQKDADQILKMIDDAKKGIKGVDDADSSNSDKETLEIDDMTPEEIRKNSAKLFAQR